MKPVVAITQRMVKDVPTGEMRDALDQRWHLFAESCGFTLLALPNHLASAQAALKMTQMVGVILTGGGDTPSTGATQTPRDEVEMFLIKQAIENNTPLFAVCRGMQMLGEYFGIKPVRVSGHVVPSHPVTIDGARDNVNSFHDYALPSVPGNFDVFALANDNVIEAMRHKTRRITGIMWHPEREAVFTRRDVTMFTEHFKVQA